MLSVKKCRTTTFGNVTLVGEEVFLCVSRDYWRQRADERLGDPKVLPVAFGGQRMGWKTPREPPGSALLLSV